MERTISKAGMMICRNCIGGAGALLGALLWAGPGYSETAMPPTGQSAGNQAAGNQSASEQPAPLELSRDCRYTGKSSAQSIMLPNVVKALQTRKLVRLLVMGGADASRQLSTSNSDFMVEHLIEKTVKGLQIEVIDRGVSGELSRDAASRLEVEVALSNPDVVLWQVGTMDALAGIPVDEIKATITNSVRWLRAHNVDLVLIGMQYSRRLRRDKQYQRVRAAIRDVAAKENVLRVGRYEAEEILDNARIAKKDTTTSKFDQSENGYNCVAEYVAKAMIAGMFVKRGGSAKPR